MHHEGFGLACSNQSVFKIQDLIGQILGGEGGMIRRRGPFKNVTKERSQEYPIPSVIFIIVLFCIEHRIIS